jgi:hypothetical protein
MKGANKMKKILIKENTKKRGGENRMKKIVVLFFVVAMLMMATSAMAIPITGEINFSGALTLTGGSTLLTATGINFENPCLVVDTVSGTYVAIPSFPSDLPLATYATFTDFLFSAVPVTPLWTLTDGVNTYYFDLSSITSKTATKISGTGVLGATGFDNTVGLWTLTTQEGTTKMSFSSTSSVPEPGVLLLLGSGLAGLAFFGRFRRK